MDSAIDSAMENAMESAEDSWAMAGAQTPLCCRPITLCQHGAESPTLVVYNASDVGFSQAE